MPPGQIAAVKATLVRTHAGKCREMVEAFLENPQAMDGPILLQELAAIRR